jgi:hypothetical protein
MKWNESLEEKGANGHSSAARRGEKSAKPSVLDDPALFGRRLALSLSPASEVVTKREIGCEPLAHDRNFEISLAVALARL